MQVRLLALAVGAVEREQRLLRHTSGGLYREALSAFCAELKSDALSLFIPCPNAHNRIGNNQDKFIPRSSAVRPFFHDSE
jgi:hypothetical protein